MAKELPYFKFEPAEYLTKDISFCSLSAQGLFINICSYYWQRGCNLTKEQLLRRLNHEQELNELISEGVIDLKDGVIKIKFLDNQLLEVESTSVKNSVNGKKGGRPRKEENPTESQIKPNEKPNINPTESQTKGIREDEIKEDNNLEEEKAAFDKNLHLEPKATGIKIEDCFHKQYAAEMKTESEWMENTSMQLKLDLSKIPKALEDFNSHLITIDKKHPNKRLYKEHFMSWARKAKEISESKQRQSKQDRL